jgi:hypothetical protein
MHDVERSLHDGYHVSRQMLVKPVGQFTSIPSEPELNSDVYALQLSVMF